MAKKTPKLISSLELVTQQRLAQQRLTKLEDELAELAATVTYLTNQLAEGVPLSLKVAGRPLPATTSPLAGRPC